jgi:AAA+ superfamily predicted ATPase
MNHQFKDRIISLIESLQPVIHLDTYDLNSADQLIRDVSSDFTVSEFHLGSGLIDFETKKRLKSWNVKQFFEHFDSKESGNHILILKDVDDSLLDPVIQYYIKSIAFKNLYKEGYYVTLFIVSHKLIVPLKLRELTESLFIPLPNREEIYSIIKDFRESFDIQIPVERCSELASSLLGLNRVEIVRVLNMSYQRDGTLLTDIDEFSHKKSLEIVKQSRNLELIESSVTMDDIGGVAEIKSYFLRVSKIFKEYEKAKNFGVEIPKAVLLSGVVGSGKSLLVRALANMLQLPLVEMSFNRIRVGSSLQSERMLRETLQTAELLKPSLLWVTDVDEIDYLFHKLLKWINGEKQGIFVIITINERISSQLNSWDFDKSFHIDLPKEYEREEMFHIHLRKRKQKLKNIDIYKLIQSSDGLNGAEISHSIKLAVESVFIENRELNSDDILYQLDEIRSKKR